MLAIVSQVFIIVGKLFHRDAAVERYITMIDNLDVPLKLTTSHSPATTGTTESTC